MLEKSVLLVTSLIVGTITSGGTVAAELGDIPKGGFRSPEGDPRFSAEAGVEPLNNLVFELLNLESPDSGPHLFRNPREGWIYLRISPHDQNRPTTVQVNDKVVLLKTIDNHLEAMCFLAEGTHTVRLSSEPNPIKQLEVRAIGELVYATYGLNPHIKETGAYIWDFLRRHCLDHHNSVIGSGTLNDEGNNIHEVEIREWSSEGNGGLPGNRSRMTWRRLTKPMTPGRTRWACGIR